MNARSCITCGYTPIDADARVTGVCIPGNHDVALVAPYTDLTPFFTGVNAGRIEQQMEASA